MLLTGVQAGLPERAKLQDEVVSSRRYELRQRSSCSMGVSVQRTPEWRRNPQEEMVAREKDRTGNKSGGTAARHVAEITILTSNDVSYSLRRICKTSMTIFATSTDSIFGFGGFGFLFPESLIHSVSASNRSRIMDMRPSGGETCRASCEDSITNVLRRRDIPFMNRTTTG